MPLIPDPHLPKGSWAWEEFHRNHRPVTRHNYMNGNMEVDGYERIHLPTPEWFGKPALIGPLANSIILCR
jgi:hypothetical protein